MKAREKKVEIAPLNPDLVQFFVTFLKWDRELRRKPKKLRIAK